MAHTISPPALTDPKCHFASTSIVLDCGTAALTLSIAETDGAAGTQLLLERRCRLNCTTSHHVGRDVGLSGQCCGAERGPLVSAKQSSATIDSALAEPKCNDAVRVTPPTSGMA